MVKCASWVSWVPGTGLVTLFDERDGSYHALNQTASAIWQALDEGMEPARAGEALAERTSTPLAQVQGDIDAFIALALDKGLLVCD